MRADIDSVAGMVAEAAQPLTGGPHDYDALIERIGEAPLVLLGEATHGTHEFYRARAEITRRLIVECGFQAVAVEADWPDAYRVNRYVRGRSEDRTAAAALSDLRRFPRWMWRNADVLNFVGWLREHNESQADERRAGFYGLDLYSLYASADAVIRYLDTVDPEAAAEARSRYGCLEDVGDGARDAEAYGRAVRRGLRRACTPEVLEQLIELRRKSAEYLQRDGRLAEDEQFFAEQNARVVRNAEAYYRELFDWRVNTWNLRDEHMAETLGALDAHLARGAAAAKIVVWAHNSHVGDARATAMHERGELNLGQLARQRWGDQAVLVGFTTYSGTVAAAADWDAPVVRQRVRPALPESIEAVFHQSGLERFVLLHDASAGAALLRELEQPRLERAIGVVYRPQSERASHYFACRIADQFDAVLHFDETRAVEPLDRSAGWSEAEPAETYPFGV